MDKHLELQAICIIQASYTPDQGEGDVPPYVHRWIKRIICDAMQSDGQRLQQQTHTNIAKWLDCTYSTLHLPELLWVLYRSFDTCCLHKPQLSSVSHLLAEQCQACERLKKIAYASTGATVMHLSRSASDQSWLVAQARPCAIISSSCPYRLMDQLLETAQRTC